jgi:uncharacterized surface protein with fasciclin (FAS1) repeats
MKKKCFGKSLLSVVLAAGLGSAFALETNEEITMLQGLQEDENFTTLVSLLESSGLAQDLSEAGDVTLFAPTNAAFEALSEDQLMTLSEDTAALTEVLQLHVLQGEYPVLDLNNAEGTLSSVSGEAYVVEQSAGGLTINGAGLESTDVDNFYSNGVVHVVSGVILPASVAASDATGTTMTTDTTDETTGVAVPAIVDTNNDGVLDANDIADSNNDGVVDEQDYTAAGVTDVNNDGVVDAQDLVATGTATTEDAAAENSTAQDATDQQDMADMATDFASYDANADGQVDSAEFQAGFELGTTFSNFDTDGDGNITQEEFSQGFVTLLDTDGDGFLSESEWSAASVMLRDSSETLTQ